MTNRSLRGSILVHGPWEFPFARSGTMRTPAHEPSLFPFPAHSPLVALRRAVRGDEFWEPSLKSLLNDSACPFTLHLAVLVNPWLQEILDGRKTVESRFSVFRCAPYGCVEAGDVILLKKSGGNIVGICQAAETRSYVLNPQSLCAIREEFSEAIGTQDAAFWNARARAKYATLVTVQNVRSVRPLPWRKSDRRGWVVIRAHGSPP